MIRKQAKLTQHELAIGIISVSHLSNLEANRYKASSETIKLLSKRLNVNLQYLNNYSKNNNLLENKILDLKRAIILNPVNAKQIIQGIELPIENLELEINYYLLRASYFYKLNQFEEALEINRNFIYYYISFLQESLDSLPKLLKESTLYYFGMKNYRENNLLESNICFKKLLELTNEDNLKSNLLYNIALINHNHSNRLEAFENANKALNLYIDLQHWDKIGELYNFLGVIYREASLIDSALLYFEKALNIAVQMNFKKVEERIHHNKGLVLEDLGDFENAVKSFRLSYNLKKRSNSNLFITVSCLIRCYIKNNNISLAKQLTKESLSMIENQKQYHILKALEAEIHYIENDYELFIEKMTQSISYFEKHHFIKEVSGLSSKVANFYISKKKYKSAALYYKKELQIKNKLKKG